MNNLVLHRESTDQAIALPEPRCGAIAIRTATLDDIPFIDALQKQHNKMVGFFPRVWFESNIKTGHVLIAEETTNTGETPVPPKPLGYCVYKDKYLKREELGIVYQLNVLPGKQRGLIGASLVKAAFERCPWGVKLFCCWCAQDIEANHFWESIGFVPIAFRTGSRPRKRKDGTVSKPERIHIFWQRRIREGDTETPYWFPSETSGGAVRENRIVLPIPPGTHWSDAIPAVLPGLPANMVLEENPHPQGEGAKKKKRARKNRLKTAPSAPAKLKGGLWFGPSAAEVAAAKAEEKERKKRERPRNEKQKNDPKYVAAARELRDRYLEEVNSGGSNMLSPASYGKYDVSRQLDAAPMQLQSNNLLDAA